MADYKIKVNKNHGGKEFKTFFRFIGKLSPISKKDQQTESWEELPLYQQKTTQTGKPRRVLQFELETALSNRLRFELAGMEQPSAWPYSSKHKTAHKVAWADRNNKKAFPDDTYHPIEVDWDKAERYGNMIERDKFYEVKGHYEISSFVGNDGNEVDLMKRVIDSIRVVESGLIVNEDGTTETIKHAGEEFDYVEDFTASNFREVNYFSMQLGVRSTYQDESKDTKVNGVILSYGKERSTVNDIELYVPYVEVEGKNPLADAFATLEEKDFIEVTGTDNNRATFAYVDVATTVKDDDPFANVDDSQTITRKERVTNGDQKGLEISGFVGNSLMRGFLNEEEMTKAATTTKESAFTDKDSKDSTSSENGGITDNPFDEEDENPFAEEN